MDVYVHIKLGGHAYTFVYVHVHVHYAYLHESCGLPEVCMHVYMCMCVLLHTGVRLKKT